MLVEIKIRKQNLTSLKNTDTMDSCRRCANKNAKQETKNIRIIAGVDEAGRGPLAGPVVAAALILPENYENSLINDSKKLSAKKRDLLYDELLEAAEDYAIVAVGNRRIDRFNIREATKLAMRYALERTSANEAWIDGNMTIDTDLKQKTIVKGDQKYLEIAGASILAKVYRDRLMQTLDQKYPGYLLSKHAGYPTKLHKELILELGPTAIHRLSFRGVRTV